MPSLNIESVARQREALAALGRLAAGLAHEINNPASAATRAVDALAETSEALVGSLGRLAAAALSADQSEAVDALRREIDRGSGTMPPLAVAGAVTLRSVTSEYLATTRCPNLSQYELSSPA